MTLVELLASIVSTTIDSGVFAAVVVASAAVLHASWPFGLRLSLLHVGFVSLSILPTSKSHEMPIIYSIWDDAHIQIRDITTPPFNRWLTASLLLLRKMCACIQNAHSERPMPINDNLYQYLLSLFRSDLSSKLYTVYTKLHFKKKHNNYDSLAQKMQTKNCFEIEMTKGLNGTQKIKREIKINSVAITLKQTIQIRF